MSQNRFRIVSDIRISRNSINSLFKDAECMFTLTGVRTEIENDKSDILIKDNGVGLVLELTLNTLYDAFYTEYDKLRQIINSFSGLTNPTVLLTINMDKDIAYRKTFTLLVDSDLEVIDRSVTNKGNAVKVTLSSLKNNYSYNDITYYLYNQ